MYIKEICRKVRGSGNSELSAESMVSSQVHHIDIRLKTILYHFELMDFNHQLYLIANTDT